MPLTGVNKLCKTCINKCKQWEQVIVCRCPVFRPKKAKKAELTD